MRTVIFSIILSFFIFDSYSSSAQKYGSDTLFINGDVLLITDSIPMKFIEEVVVKVKPSWKQRRKVRHYNKLYRRVKKVYPFAKVANERISEIEKNVANYRTKREKKQYLAIQEKKLRKEFEKELVKLSFSEGRILIKLIDRETGDTSYELIKDLRGNLSAVFWQSIARLFGSNLKATYDSENDDKLIERIIVRIENQNNQK